MKFYVAVTDDNWFKFLAERAPDEVNFWRPGGAQSFKAIEPGGLFLFKLHSPRNFIAGGGFFLRHTVLPLGLAWKAFGEKNGADSLARVRQMIQARRHDNDPNPHIGCTILTQPFFWPEDLWIPIPSDWASNIVAGRTYDTENPIGAKLTRDVQERLTLTLPASEGTGVSEEDRYTYYLTRGRIGQGAFRVLVTDAYHRRCAVTGERTLPVLEAAHIRPYSEDGPNRISNGLLLRSDLHILFDNGYMTVTPDLHVEISKRIDEEYHNGKEYYKLHGQTLSVQPETKIEQPSREFIEWHNENVFVA